MIPTCIGIIVSKALIISDHWSQLGSYVIIYLVNISLLRLEHVCKNCLHWNWLCNSLVLSHYQYMLHCSAMFFLLLRQSWLGQRIVPLQLLLLAKNPLAMQVLVPAGFSPNCLQTTPASVSSHIWSHTVPHSSFRQISTRPSKLLLPPTSLTSPAVHPIIKREIYLPSQV